MENWGVKKKKKKKMAWLKWQWKLAKLEFIRKQITATKTNNDGDY